MMTIDLNTIPIIIKHKLLICPNCLNEIPEFTLIQLPQELLIQTKCCCQKETQKMSLESYLQIIENNASNLSYCSAHKKKSEKYCLECGQVFCTECLFTHSTMTQDHKLLDSLIQIICKEHKIANKYYCQNFTKCVCKQCDIHKEHKLIKVKKAETKVFESELKLLSPLMERIKERKNNLIERFKQSNITIIDDNGEPINIEQSLKDLYEHNYKMNQLLQKFIERLVESIGCIKPYSNYYLMKILSSLCINKQDVYSRGNDLEELYHILKGYLKNHYIIYQLSDKCTTTFKNTDPIQCITQYANKGEIVFGNKTGEIKYWNSKTLAMEKEIIAHQGSVRALLKLKNGLLVSCSGDRTIKNWAADMVTCLKVLSGHSDCIYSIIQLNNSNLASCSKDKTIRIWDLDKKLLEASLEGHSNFVYCLIQLQNNQLASGSGDQSIKLWSLNANSCNGTLKGHHGAIYCLFQLDNQKIISGSSDSTIKIWDSITLKCESTLYGHSSFVVCLIQLIDKKIASSSYDKTIRIWNKPSANSNYVCSFVYYSHTSYVNSIIQLKDGNLASAGEDLMIKKWKL